MSELNSDTESNALWLDDFRGDKYSVRGANVNCSSRIHKCKAACCRLPFALTQQDVDEEIALYEPDLKYCIKQEKNNYCCHINRDSYECTIYKNRPFKCHVYDCSNDGRIWEDFERMIVNPDINHPKWPQTLVEIDI